MCASCYLPCCMRIAVCIGMTNSLACSKAYQIPHKTMITFFHMSFSAMALVRIVCRRSVSVTCIWKIHQVLCTNVKYLWCRIFFAVSSPSAIQNYYEMFILQVMIEKDVSHIVEMFKPQSLSMQLKLFSPSELLCKFQLKFRDFSEAYSSEWLLSKFHWTMKACLFSNTSIPTIFLFISLKFKCYYSVLKSFQETSKCETGYIPIFFIFEYFVGCTGGEFHVLLDPGCLFLISGASILTNHYVHIAFSWICHWLTYQNLKC